MLLYVCKWVSIIQLTSHLTHIATRESGLTYQMRSRRLAQGHQMSHTCIAVHFLVYYIVYTSGAISKRRHPSRRPYRSTVGKLCHAGAMSCESSVSNRRENGKPYPVSVWIQDTYTMHPVSIRMHRVYCVYKLCM